MQLLSFQRLRFVGGNAESIEGFGVTRELWGQGEKGNNHFSKSEPAELNHTDVISQSNLSQFWLDKIVVITIFIANDTKLLYKGSPMKTSSQILKAKCHIEMILAMILFATSAFGTTYYVATNGSDSNAGTSTTYPFATINKGLSLAQPGDTVQLAAGTYRQTGSFVRAGTYGHEIVLRGAGGQTVIVQGSTLETGFALYSGAIYVKSGWTTYFSPNDPSQTDARALPRDQLFVDGVYYPEATSLATMTAGTFFTDHPNSKLYLWLTSGGTPTGHNVDADTTGLILSDAYDYTEIEDLQFQYCANEAQSGMVTVSGSHCVLNKCVFQYGAGAGLSFGGANSQVDNCTFNYNTQEGFNSSSSSITSMSGCISNYNNTEPDKVFDPGWEAGGNKISRSDRFVIKNHTSTGNYGPGIWFDIDNQDATIDDCTCTHNIEGIQYEISYTALIYNNICAYNSDDGFLISSSAGNFIANNLAYSNTDFGITSVDADAPRGDGNGNYVYCYANTFYNNIVASNQIAPYQKSYVINSSTTVQAGLGSDPVVPFSPNYSDYNLFYYSGPAEPFFIDQKDHYEPDTLAEWQAHNGYDLHSIWAEDPLLINPSGGNYDLQSGSPAINTGITLSEVPVDIIGTARPQGGAYDMGPYEYITP